MYDIEYMQRHNEDLNTLIFVRFLRSIYRPLTRFSGRSVFPLSAPPSSSTSSPSSSQTLLNGQKPTSAQFSSASTDLLFQTKTPPLPQHGMVPPQRLSQPQTSCMQAF